MPTPCFINCHSCRAMMSAFICLILIPVLAMSLLIDEQIVTSSTSRHAFDFFHLNSEHTVEVKTEFDMMLTLDQYKAFYMSTTNMNSDTKINLWPFRKVEYEITDTARKYTSTIMNAIRHWQKYTCILFSVNTKSLGRLQFVNGDTCWSHVGMIEGMQIISLTERCASLETVIHEIGHTIGFIHEQMRSDRNRYITINYLGITKKYRRQYKQYNATFNTYNVPYDYTSVMHFGGLGIIQTVDPAYQKIIGTSKSLSFKDIKRANLMYQCQTKAGNCPPKTCPYNGFVLFKEFNEKAKCECWCDTGNVSDPLVQCSSISQEVAQPNIQLRSSRVVLGNVSRCVDMRINCIELRSKGMCVTDMEMMLSDCLKTCNFCGRMENLCIDYEENCFFLSGSGMCSDIKMKDTLSKLCKKSCGYCTGSTSTCDIQQVMESMNTAVDITTKWIHWLVLLLFLTVSHIVIQ